MKTSVVKSSEEGEKPEHPDKNPRSGERTNNKLNPYLYGIRLGLNPGPHWWEVNTLTTAPSLLPCMFNKV